MYNVSKAIVLKPLVTAKMRESLPAERRDTALSGSPGHNFRAVVHEVGSVDAFIEILAKTSICRQTLQVVGYETDVSRVPGSIFSSSLCASGGLSARNETELVFDTHFVRSQT